MNTSSMNGTEIATAQGLPHAVHLTFSVLFSVFVVPSLLLFLLNFYYLIRFRAKLIYKKLHHHFIIGLLISDFLLVATQVPLTFINLYAGSIPKISQLCTYWIYCTYALFGVSEFLTMFGSIQRYVLVFHKAFYMKWKMLTHYCTLLFCFLYPLIYYLYFIFFYPCTNSYDYTQALCGEACYTYIKNAVLIDYFMNILLPTCTIVIVNFTLLLKVILLKRRMASNNNASADADGNLWKKNRRMIVQLMTIASATSLAWLPFIICAIVDTFDTTFVSGNVLTLLNYLPYFNCMLTPFIALVTLWKEVTDELLQVMPVQTGTVKNNNTKNTINNKTGTKQHQAIAEDCEAH